MRILRALLGSLLWILAGVVGLLGVLLTVTLILAPVGIPLLMLARRLFKYSMTMFLPRSVRHPASELGKSARGMLGKAGDKASDGLPKIDVGKTRKRARKMLKKQKKRMPAWAK